MTRAHCDWCGGNAIVGTTCPKSLPCPKCEARPGKGCKRPSGHEAMTLHAERIAAAEARDRANAQLPDNLFDVT